MLFPGNLGVTVEKDEKNEVRGERREFCYHGVDNAAHTFRTMDGLNTFHGLGINATFTPCLKSTS